MFPPLGGFKRDVLEVILVVGMVVDRYGYPNGRYVSPQGTPFWQRSLPAQYLLERPYHAYIVITSIHGVEAGHAVGHFGFLGCGVQWRSWYGVAI